MALEGGRGTVARAILVVEDDATVARLIRMTLEREGYRLDIVTTLAAGMRALDAEDYDLLILDLALPDGHGLDFLRSTQDSGVCPPVLILSSYRQEDTIVAGLECGAEDYLTKPFSTRELLVRVTKRLQSRDDSDVAPAW